MLDYIYLFNGVTVAYVEAVDLVAQALLEIQPTVIAAVPRFFERSTPSSWSREAKPPESSANYLTGRLMLQARRTLADRREGCQPTLESPVGSRRQTCLQKKSLRNGGKLRMIFSGGAPLSKDLAEFFWSVGIPIYQGYGLTETSPILTSNYPKNRSGSSGRPIPNALIRIAADGEVLAKAPA